jgi:hypothetical protein
MKLGARVFWVNRVDMGNGQPPQVRVQSGTLLSVQEDVATVIEGTPVRMHPDKGPVTVLRGVMLYPDCKDADAFAFGLANRLIVNFRFKAVDVWYANGQSHQLTERKPDGSTQPERVG